MIKITLVDNDKVISDNVKLCKIFSKLFPRHGERSAASDSSDISNYSHSDLVNNAVRNYENHSIMKNIRETIINFSFLWR